MEEQPDPVVLDVEPPKKPKRVMSEAQQQSLARGRAALAAKRAAAKNIQVVPIETTDDEPKKPSKPATPKMPDPPPPEPPAPPPVEPPAKAKLSKTRKAIKELPKKQMSAVERDQKKYMEKETKAQLQQARRLRDAAEAREMSLNSIIEQKVAREVANYKRQEKLKKAAELLQQEAAKPPPAIPQPRVHYEDSEEEEEIEETPERSVTFETPRPTSNPLQGRAWANDPYFAKMMARMR